MRQHTVHRWIVILFFVSMESLHGSPTTIADGWSRRLNSTAALLEKSAYQTALPQVEKLCDEIADAPEPGSVSTRTLLVRALTQRAVAESGTGHSEDALWYWAAAQNIEPQSAAAELSGFGAPVVALLRDHILEMPLPRQCPEYAAGSGRPAVTKTVPLRFPEGARQHRVQGLFVAEVTVDTRGRASNPRVIAHLPATMEYAALESIRQWTFDPAVQSGTQVTSEYCASVNFRLK